MKVLVIDLCYEKESLHFNEFVQPVIDIVKSASQDCEVIHFLDLENKDLNSYNKVILCGVALKDFEYINHLDKFHKLKEFKGQVLGICAGSQIIGKLFDCKLIDNQEIGLINLEILKKDKIFNEVDLSEVYCLHNSCIKVNESFEVLARSDNCTQVFKKNNFYGVLFHPEVRNKKLIKNFINF